MARAPKASSDDELYGLLKAATVELKAARAEAERQSVEAQQAKSEADALKEEVHVAQEAAQMAQEALAREKSISDELRARAEGGTAVGNDFGEFPQKVSQLESQLNDLTGRLEDAEGATAKEKHRAEELEGRIAEFEAELATRAERVEALERQISEAASSGEAGSAAAEGTRQELEAAHAKVAELEDQMVAQAEAARQAEDRDVGNQNALAEVQAALEAERAKAGGLDEAVLSSRRELELREQAMLEEQQRTTESLNEQHAQAGRALEEQHQQAIASEAARAQEMLAAEIGKTQDAQTQLEAEKSKHQGTAHKLLDTRAKVRELEGQAAELKGQIEQLTAQIAAAEETARKQAEAHSLALDAEQMLIAQLEKELEAEKTHASDIDRSFAALHRELLTVVDQRDDAVRRAEAERAERQRIEKSMMGGGRS